MTLKEKIDSVKENIVSACRRSGRNPEHVKLCLVTKNHPASLINEALDCGVEEIGENRVQELLQKISEIKKTKINFIGHLQTNKVKYIIDIVDLIQSVDSLRLLHEINLHAEKKNRVMELLLQVNVAGETQKYGFSEKRLQEALEYAESLPFVRVIGLMNIAPFVENPELVRQDFRKMKKLLTAYSTRFPDLRELSMGMSGDYRVAVEEGATIVRIGSLILGDR